MRKKYLGISVAQLKGKFISSGKFYEKEENKCLAKAFNSKKKLTEKVTLSDKLCKKKGTQKVF